MNKTSTAGFDTLYLSVFTCTLSKDSGMLQGSVSFKGINFQLHLKPGHVICSHLSNRNSCSV
jgi:hypothetical protein